MKSFYTRNHFFKIVIDTNMITFCIISDKCKNINIYNKWLVNLNWLKKIFRLKNLNLKSFKI